jgi:hypothetical protein
MIFISYRKADSQAVVDHLADKLTTVFGAAAVFKDDRTLRPGDPWPDEIRQAVLNCDVLLAVLGDAWLTAADEYGRRRLDDAEDWVRQEIGTALERDKVVIPVLLGGARLPPKKGLPRGVLRRLCDRQTASLRSGADLDGDIALLIKELRNHVRPAPSGPGLRLFFDHLIESHTKLFAGRDAEIARILDFIRDPGSGYVFLEGLSGYGKTSLLAHLVSKHPDFAYHFISQGYKSSGSDFDPTQFEALLANLCEQLEPGTAPGSDLRALRVRFQRLLQSPPARRPTVLVLDAVDEVDLHPNYLLGLLPRRLPPGVIVILSARTQGERCYLTEIGLDPADVGLSLRLSGLDESAIAQLLERAGGQAAEAARQPEFVARLHALSGGDPFYLRFLAEDVAGGTLTALNLRRAPSGLSGYLDRQMSQLNRSAYRPQHRDILGLILTARGGLSRADLLRLVPGLDGFNFDDVLRDIHRFLLVHQGQYTFCHGRFKEYFAAKVQ